MSAQQPTVYREVRHLIRAGDVLLYRRPGSWIGNVGRSPYSHAAMVVVYPGWHDRTLLAAESREFQGSHLKTLSSQVARYHGRIDVFRPTCGNQIAEEAADLAVKQAGHQYNYRGIVWLGLLHAPLVRNAIRWYPDTTDMTLSAWDAPKFCSQLVVWCLRVAAQWLKSSWEVIHQLGDRWCEPGDLARGNIELMWPELVLA